MEDIVLYHGSKQQVEYPEIRISKYTKDFYYGFYCTVYKEQAKRWATRFTGEGVLNKYIYTPNDNLRIIKFKNANSEWLDFVVACRLGIPHDYDIVEGPMADDTIFGYVQDFADKKISREAFFELVKFKKPTHQISFHTAKALTTIKFLGGEKVYVKV